MESCIGQESDSSPRWVLEDGYNDNQVYQKRPSANWRVNHPDFMMSRVTVRKQDHRSGIPDRCNVSRESYI